MKVWTKWQSHEKARQQGDQDPLQCIQCKIGYYVFVFPSNGGHFTACSWCHDKIEDEDFENLIMIREIRRREGRTK